MAMDAITNSVVSYTPKDQGCTEATQGELTCSSDGCCVCCYKTVESRANKYTPCIARYGVDAYAGQLIGQKDSQSARWPFNNDLIFFCFEWRLLFTSTNILIGVLDENL